MISIDNSKYFKIISVWFKNSRHLWKLASFVVIGIVIGGLVYILSISQLAGDLRAQLDTLQGKSTIFISVEEKKNEARISWTFRIADSDKDAALAYGKKLGLSEDWLKGSTLVVNTEVARQLVNILPLTAEVEFVENEMKLSAGEMTILNSSLPEKEYQLATGSSQLKVNYRNPQNFNLKVNKPWQVLNHATASGQLYLAPVLLEQLVWMDRLGEVMLKVDNKNIEGSLLLK